MFYEVVSKNDENVLQAHGESRGDVVVVGEKPVQEKLQLLTLADKTTYNVTFKRTYSTPDGGNPSLSMVPESGTLTYVGETKAVELKFGRAPQNFIGTIFLEYSIINSDDKSEQSLLVAVEVRSDLPHSKREQSDCFLTKLKEMPL